MNLYYSQDLFICIDSLSVPSRGSSFQHSPSSMNRQSENQPPDNPKRHSRYNSTSNTWTSSSGEVSETDDIGDRSFYVQAFNKIANKVSDSPQRRSCGVRVG
jgi:hypothetical protein